MPFHRSSRSQSCTAAAHLSCGSREAMDEAHQKSLKEVAAARRSVPLRRFALRNRSQSSKSTSKRRRTASRPRKVDLGSGWEVGCFAGGASIVLNGILSVVDVFEVGPRGVDGLDILDDGSNRWRFRRIEPIVACFLDLLGSSQAVSLWGGRFWVRRRCLTSPSTMW